MQYWASPSEERRRRTEKKEKQFGRFGAFWFGTFVILFCAIRDIVGHGNTRRWMVRCYKRLSVHRVWDLERFLYIACPCSPYIRVYRLYDTYLPLPLDSQPAANTWNTGQGFITLLKDMNLIVTLLNPFSLWSMSVFTMANRAQMAHSYKQPAVITWCCSLGGEICYSVLLYSGGHGHTGMTSIML